MARQGFRLQPVLNYREQIVEMRQQELAALERALQAERLALATLQGRIQAVAREIRDAQRSVPLDCARIVEQFIYLQELQNREKEQKERIASLTKEVEAKRAELVQAMQEKETIEKLKERFLAQQREEELRQEVKTLDEISVVRFHRESVAEEVA